VSRRGDVFVNDVKAGTIEETDDGEYRFTYAPDYLERADAQPVSLTLPLRAEPYVAEAMFPFFDGLIPEGWLLNLVSKNWKLDPGDRMALLLSACRDCIGAVHVVDQRERAE
jgi:serine/threonine-protein kinase HipA